MAENKQEWEARGDVNPREHGGMWIREDSDCAGSFYIWKWEPFTERGGDFGYISSGYVTPTDDWIDGKMVREYIGISEDADSREQALAVFNTYACENFNGNLDVELWVIVKNILKSEGIEL